MHDDILDLVRQAHALTESAAVATSDPTTRKQYVLADLSLHLVQAALRRKEPDPAELKRYLFSILTVCDGFVPDMDLKAMANVVLPLPAEDQSK
ncbi:hypothetical protein LJY25_17445 [Hymenobacter sp. BT175]|uniref:hypothetical protein n=1 Tax=Hymenobacter translucens TaxID=2886507 RepID=UPI001D0F2F86|nr:hypothetical protein [Hymenobacter translucens]MCC2548239.1 hypothetical protein [Hymenobacter translucens]